MKNSKEKKVMTKENVKKAALTVLEALAVGVAVGVSTAVIACGSAIIGGRIALREFTEDGVNIKVNKVEDAVTFEEV